MFPGKTVFVALHKQRFRIFFSLRFGWNRCVGWCVHWATESWIRHRWPQTQRPCFHSILASGKRRGVQPETQSGFWGRHLIGTHPIHGSVPRRVPCNGHATCSSNHPVTCSTCLIILIYEYIWHASTRASNRYVSLDYIPTCCPNTFSKPFQHLFPLVANIEAIDSHEKALLITSAMGSGASKYLPAPESPGPAPHEAHIPVRTRHFLKEIWKPTKTGILNQLKSFWIFCKLDVSGIHWPLFAGARMLWKEL